MLTLKKYDVVISFSEEQRDIAVAIAITLENWGISTYYYLYKVEENIGKDLELQLIKTYNSSAILAIAIFSKKYFSSHYTKIELRAILERLELESDYLIPIRYNAIRSDLEHLTYFQWNSDPIEISEIIKKRLEKKIGLYLEDSTSKISKLSKSALSDAIMRFSKYKNIENPEFYFRLALYHYHLCQSREDFSKAKELLKIVISYNPTSHQAYYWLCKVIIEEKGIHAMTYRDIQQPVDYLIKALSLSPQESSYINYANLLNTVFYKKHGLTSPFKNQIV